MIENPKALAIARASRAPGYRELLELLDELADSVSRDAFSNDDDSKAVHLLYEARGARRVVDQFKNRVAALADEVMQEIHANG